MQRNSEKKTRIDWENLIAEQEISGLSQKEFCIQRGLSISQLVYHRVKLKNKGKVTQSADPILKPVKIVAKETSPPSADIKLSLPNGLQCSFPCFLNIIQIRQLVEVLLSC